MEYLPNPKNNILDRIWNPCVAYLGFVNKTLLTKNKTLLAEKPHIKILIGGFDGRG
jgi:hypothetical protein